MTTTISLCSIAVMLISCAIIIYAFYGIFREQVANENDMNVIQRQLRGFALLMVSNIVMVLGMLLCTGSLLPYFMEVAKTVGL